MMMNTIRPFVKDIYVSAVYQSAFYHMLALKHTRPDLTEDIVKSVAFALIGSWLDYANSVLYGMPENNIARGSAIVSRLDLQSG